MSEKSDTLQFGPYKVELSNLDKGLFPESGYSKQDLIDYYRSVASVMLPHMRDRPLILQRFPDGIGEEGFIQQRRSEHFPDWLESISTPRVDDAGEEVEHTLCNNEAGLVYLANQAVVTFHGWLSRKTKLSCPDRLVFDLDPQGDEFGPVRQAARWVGELMHDIGLTPYVMTTGSSGLHVVAPLRPESDFDKVRGLGQRMADYLQQRHPDILTTAQRKADRGERVYLDVMRNAYGQSAVLPYSVRPLPGAPVATPLEWDEIERPDLGPRNWNISNMTKRLGQKDDPWGDIERHRALATTALEKLSALEG